MLTEPTKIQVTGTKKPLLNERSVKEFTTVFNPLPNSIWNCNTPAHLIHNDWFYIYNILIFFVILSSNNWLKEACLNIKTNEFFVICLLIHLAQAMHDLFKVVLFFLKNKNKKNPKHLYEMKVDTSTTLCLDLELHREK